MSPFKSKKKAHKSIDPDEFRMSFGDHLDELRRRLIYSMIGVGVILIGTLWFGRDIIRWLVMPLAQAQDRLGLPTGANAFSPLSPFAVYMKVSIVTAIVLGAPWILRQMWKFVETGLYAAERKIVMVLYPFSMTMVVLGVMFMYYVLLPISISFLLHFATTYPESGGGKSGFMDWVDRISPFTDSSQTTGDGVEPGAPDEARMASAVAPSLTHLGVPMLLEDPEEPANGQMWINTKRHALKVAYDGNVRTIIALGTESMLKPVIGIDEYIGFVLLMTIGIVIGFQLPVVMLIGGWTGVLPPRLVTKYRKQSLFVCAVLGALLTPSDPLSMMVLALPLYVLFEFGLVLMRMTYKPRGFMWDDAPEDDGEKKV